MGLTITQTHALIGIERNHGRLEMQSQNAELKLHQKLPKVNIDTEPVVVEIDQYEARASAGLKNSIDRARDIAQMAYQQVMEYIGKTAADGDMLAAVENGGTPIADIAERDAYPEHEFGMDTIPKVGPKFNVRGGTVNIEAERNWEGANNGVEGDYTPGNVSYNFTPTQVNIYMRQYASVSFSYEPDNKVDVRV